MKVGVTFCIRALAVIALVVGGYSFAGPGDPDDDTATVDQATVAPAGPKEEERLDLARIPSVESIIRDLQNEVTQPTSDAANVGGSAFNVRRAHDVSELGNKINEAANENEAELSRVLGDVGFAALKHLAKKIEEVGKGENGWLAIQQALDGYQPEMMEELQAKRLVIEILRREEANFPVANLTGPLALLTVSSAVRPPSYRRVLERVAEGLTQAQPTNSATLLPPVAQLLALAPYLPKLKVETQLKVLAKAIELARANTDRSDLELLEEYLTGTLLNIERTTRLNTVLGSTHAYEIGLAYLERLARETYLKEGGEGSVLVAFSRLVKTNDAYAAEARKNNWKAEIDYTYRVRWAIRTTLTKLVGEHVKLRQRLGEFDDLRLEISRNQIRESCAASVTNPLEKIIGWAPGEESI